MLTSEFPGNSILLWTGEFHPLKSRRFSLSQQVVYIMLSEIGQKASSSMCTQACHDPDRVVKHVGGAACVLRCAHHGMPTANLRTKIQILDSRGFDSNINITSRDGILLSIGNTPESLSQRILVRIFVGRLGVCVARLLVRSLACARETGVEEAYACTGGASGTI